LTVLQQVLSAHHHQRIHFCSLWYLGIGTSQTVFGQGHLFFPFWNQLFFKVLILSARLVESMLLAFCLS
jgi:hypothetical protein